MSALLPTTFLDNRYAADFQAEAIQLGVASESDHSQAKSRLFMMNSPRVERCESSSEG